jgi:flagellar hook-associated protein FlgK
MTQNLNSATAVNGTATGQVELNDSLGKSYTATVTYTRTATGPPSTWNYSIAMPDPVTPDTSVAGQVSYSFGAGETVNPATNLTITGSTGAGTATITAPTVTPGEAVGTAGPPATGYVAALDAQLTAAGITGVTISTAGNVVTIKGATATAGNVVADPVSANATGTLQFNAGGTLTSPAANVSGITFSGLSNGAVTLSLNWGLFGSSGAANVTQTASATAETGQSQNGFVDGNNQTPTDFYSTLVSTLGSTVSEVQTENTAQTASVTQLQTQSDALSGVNLNDEASFMQTFERSYQAASQVFTMLNTVMGSAINLGESTAVT